LFRFTLYPIGASSYFPGSYGCLLRSLTDGNTYILTCSHVIFNRSMNSSNGLIDDEIIIFKLGDNPASLGRAVRAWRTSTLDIGLILPDDRHLPSDFHGKWRDLTEEDRIRQTSLTFRGAETQDGKGKVHLLDWPVVVRYSDGNAPMEGMIVIAAPANAPGPVSKAGDSGAVLADSGGNAVGMIIGGNQIYSYAVPMRRILEKFDATIA